MVNYMDFLVGLFIGLGLGVGFHTPVAYLYNQVKAKFQKTPPAPPAPPA